MPELAVDGIRYAYLDEGSGPLILFGHGLAAGKEMFAAQIAVLRDRYRCVSLDWPGHGESGCPEGWDFYGMADIAAALLDELDDGPAVLAGLSQGSMAFTRLALRRPDLVHALILMSTGSRAPTREEAQEVRGLMTALRDGSDEERRALVRDVLLNILYSPAWLRDNPDRAAHEIEAILAQDREGMYRAGEAVAARDDVTSRLPEIVAPTLVIVGEDDVPTPPEEAERVVAGIGGAELVRIPAAGHHPPVENPDATTAAIETFLARIGAPSAA